MIKVLLGRAFFLLLLAPREGKEEEYKDETERKVTKGYLTSDLTDNRNFRTVLLLAYLQPL